MSATNSFLKRYGASVAGGVLVLAAFGFSRFPVLDPVEARQLAARFHFSKLPLPEVADHPPYKHVREVHPSLARISAWVSTLGAAVTLADLDGDGLPNDLCYVDPRTDLVTVAPVPRTGERYGPFALDPATTPIHPGRQALFGFSVALVYGVLQVLHIVFGLFFALVIVAGIRGLSLHVGALLGWLGQERTKEDRGRRPAAAAVLSGSAGAAT